jgi:DNA-directed RNA polymerase specialized sigma24 family protein
MGEEQYKPLAPLRNLACMSVPSFVQKVAQLDKTANYYENKSRHALEKSMKKGELSIDSLKFEPSAPPIDMNVRLIFWDALRDMSREKALYMVLVHCLGYSRVEIAAGLEVPLSRVKYVTSETFK